MECGMELNEDKLTVIANNIVLKLLAEDSEFREELIENATTKRIKPSDPTAPAVLVVNHATPDLFNSASIPVINTAILDSTISSQMYVKRKLDAKLADCLKELDNMKSCLWALLHGCRKRSLHYLVPSADDLPRSLNEGAVAGASHTPQPSSADSRMLYAVELQLQRLSANIARSSWDVSSSKRRTSILHELLPIIRAISRFTRILGVRLLKSTDSLTYCEDLWTLKSSNLQNLAHIASTISDWLRVLVCLIRPIVPGQIRQSIEDIFQQYNTNIVFPLKEQEERIFEMLRDRTKSLKSEREIKDVGSRLHQKSAALVKLRFAEGPKGALIPSRMHIVQHPRKSSLNSSSAVALKPPYRVRSAPPRTVSFERTQRSCANRRPASSGGYEKTVDFISQQRKHDTAKSHRLANEDGNCLRVGTRLKVTAPLAADVLDDVLEEIANEISSGKLKLSHHTTSRSIN